MGTVPSIEIRIEANFFIFIDDLANLFGVVNKNSGHKAKDTTNKAKTLKAEFKANS